MGELLQHHQFHHPYVAFERVKGAKHGVDRGRIFGIRLEDEHTLLDVLKEVLRLGAKQLQHFGIAVADGDFDELVGYFRCSRSLSRRSVAGFHRSQPGGAGREFRSLLPGIDGRNQPGMPLLELRDDFVGEFPVGGRSFVEPLPGRGDRSLDRLRGIATDGRR